MKHTEFLDLHATCVTAMRAYVIERRNHASCWENAPQGLYRSPNA